MRSLILGVITVLLVASSALADSIDPSPDSFSTRSGNGLGVIPWPSCSGETVHVVPALSFSFESMPFQQQADPQPLHAAAVEHSDAYLMRKKIHKIASFATLPLFATELALGQSIYTNPSTGGRRAAHIFVGTGIVSLFGVNTVTGVWNMFGEDRQDSSGRMLRLVHGLLMMASDAGFVATSMTGPNSGSQRQALTYESRATMHRNLAITSIGIGTAGYLLMLFRESLTC
jgi:hypothetical protein